MEPVTIGAMVLAAAALLTGIAAKPGSGTIARRNANDADGGIDAKFVGAVVFTVTAMVLAIVVITGGTKYSVDDKKAAWALVTLVGGFWIGVGAAKS